MATSRRIQAAAIPLAVLVMAGCGTFNGGDNAGETADGDQRLVASLQFTPRANWALETEDAYVLTQAGCLETLTWYDHTSGDLVPALATEWDQTEPTAWDFTLRDGVKFQDGTELTADAVVAALQHVLSSETPPRAFNPKVVSGVEAVDEATVRVTTPEPSPLLPLRLANVSTGILAPAAYTASGIDPMGNCTGPFTPVKEVTKQSLTVERNDEWWGGDVALAGAELRFVPEGATRATQVQTGESQIALVIPAAQVATLEGNPDVELTTTALPRTTGLYFNTSKAPFDNPEVRKAIRHALDLQAIADSVYDGSAQPAAGPFNPDEPWAPEGMEPPAQDVDQAASALQAAGIAPGQLNIQLLGYTERAEMADLATVIQASLKKVGITVDVRISDYAGIEADLLSGNYDMALLSRNHLTDIADPIGFLTADYTCEGAYNISKYCDPAFDQLLAPANSEKDPAARHEIYAEAAKRLQDNAVTAFLVHETATSAASPRVQNFVDDPLGRYLLTADLDLTAR